MSNECPVLGADYAARGLIATSLSSPRSGILHDGAVA
jgi:hypothetical protein